TSDPNTTNNQSCVNTTVVSPPPSADLSITKSGPSFVNTGAAFDYLLTVGNNGPNTATSVSVRDTLPAGVTFVSVTATGGSGWTCSQSGGIVTCTEPRKPAGETTTIDINVTAPSTAGNINNCASLPSAPPDPHPASHQSCVH